jgi:hypothetical protein
MHSDQAIHERFMACHAAIKMLIEVIIGTETARPDQIAQMLRVQAKNCADLGLMLAADEISSFAESAEDPARSGARLLLKTPPQGRG